MNKNSIAGFFFGSIVSIVLYLIIIIISEIAKKDCQERLEIKYYCCKPYERTIVKEILDSYQITNHFDIISYHMGKYDYTAEFINYRQKENKK